MENKIKLSHGDGGRATNQLIKEIFYKGFGNEILMNSLDSSVFGIKGCRLAFTTDSFVVKPLVFPGGDIGKLAVCGTVNDLTAAGAKPLYLSCGFIIEEGFDVGLLQSISHSMGDICRKTGVKIITGDTKVVEKGSADGLFINTAGIGIVHKGFNQVRICEGDEIIITGGIGEHGTTIALERYNIRIQGNIKSDCMALNQLLEKLEGNIEHVKLMKDPTRGGLATAINEISEFAGLGVQLAEENIPIKQEISSVNSLLGLDPLYLACEGRMIIVVDRKESRGILERIREVDGCESAAVIGSFISTEIGPVVYLETSIGGKRIIGPLDGEMLPRIC